VVKELKIKAAVEKQKEIARKDLIDTIVARLKGEDSFLPPNISLLEDLSTLGSKAEHAKEGQLVLEEVLNLCKLELNGRTEEKAFQLLVKIKHFSEDQNLTVIRLGRTTRFREEIIQFSKELSGSAIQASGNRKDLSQLSLVTIDAETTKDMDDAI